MLNAITYATFFMMGIGKTIVRTKPIVWTFGWAWVGRYLSLVPILFAPLFAAKGNSQAAIGLLVLGVFGFFAFRGIGLIGNNPVVAYLASGGGVKPRSDRGEFMVNNQIVNSIASMTGGLLVALSLGENAGPGAYALGIGVGIVTGLVGCFFLLKMPEPTDYSPEASSSLIGTAREAFKDPAFRRFLFVFMMFSFVSGMGRSFLPVYAKEAFGQADDAVMVYSLMSSVGAVAMGLLTRLIVDRLGSKPLFIIYSSIGLLSFLPVALVPSGSSFTGSATVAAIFLAFVHFLSAFGFAGEESTGQNYYFTLVPKEKTLDLAVVYYFAYAAGGALGSGFGGVLLDGLSWAGLNHSSSYRALYALLCLVLAFTIFRARKLRRLGSASVGQSLGIMFSIRDLRAFDLLSRLDRSATPREEIRLLHELGRSASTLSQFELVEYLNSPRFEVRMEVLLAFETMPRLSPKVVGPLIHEVEHHTFTTAYVAARVLGRHGIQEALPVLRKAMNAEDYLLQGTAVLALARIGDVESLPEIEAILMRSVNPRVKISAAYALELFAQESSLAALASSLRQDDPPAFVSDEIVLAMASIMRSMDKFYPLYSSFIEDNLHGVALLESMAADIVADARTLEEWKRAVAKLFDENGPDGSAMAAFIVRTGSSPETELVLAEAILDPRLRYKGMKFLAAAYPLFVKR
jgi:hypothetical protein